MTSCAAAAAGAAKRDVVAGRMEEVVAARARCRAVIDVDSIVGLGVDVVFVCRGQRGEGVVNRGTELFWGSLRLSRQGWERQVGRPIGQRLGRRRESVGWDRSGEVPWCRWMVGLAAKSRAQLSIDGA